MHIHESLTYHKHNNRGSKFVTAPPLLPLLRCFGSKKEDGYGNTNTGTNNK
jgi:hypothetical protein